MANHTATVNAQIGQLVELVAGGSTQQDENYLNTSKVAAIQLLKRNHYSSVNHFAVFATFEGLVEKCQIFGLDDLAEALQDRIKLSRQTNFKWLPEVLFLLLNLSHRPTENIRPQQLHATNEQHQQPSDSQGFSELTGTLWGNPDEDIEYAQSSSDRESINGSHTSSGISYQSIHSFEHAVEETRESLSPYIVPSNELKLSWEQNKLSDLKRTKKSVQVSEQNAIRQILHMLHGLPSSLFNRRGVKGVLLPIADVTIDNVDTTAFRTLLHTFSLAGLTIQTLQSYLSESHTTYTAQALADCVHDVVTELNATICSLENTVVGSNTTATLTILLLIKEVNEAIQLPEALQQVLTPQNGNSNFCSIFVIDRLYEMTCVAQDQLNLGLYRNLHKILHRCLAGYLKSVAKWTVRGELDNSELHFFVEQREATSALSEIWHSRYKIRKLNDRVSAPLCLMPAIAHLFNIGKDVALLKELKPSELFNLDANAAFTTTINAFGSGSPHTDSCIIPFQVHFLRSLKSGPLLCNCDASQQLCQHLLNDCRGWKALRALSIIYLANDFHIFDNIASCLWDALLLVNARKGVDCDRLTTSIRETLKDVNQVAVSTVRVLWPYPEGGLSEHSLHLLSHMTLLFEYGEPVKTIIKAASLLNYQAVFRLLLQLHFSSGAISQLSLQSFGGKNQTDQTSATHTSYLDPASGIALSLRFRLLWFFNVLKDHFINIVIVPAKATLERRWATAADVDGLVTAHEDFISSVTIGLFQNQSDDSIRRILLAIFDLALTFHDMTCAGDMHPSCSPSDCSTSRRTCKWHVSSPARNTITDVRGLERIQWQFKNLLELFVGALRDKARQGKRGELSYLLDRLTPNDHSTSAGG